MVQRIFRRYIVTTRRFFIALLIVLGLCLFHKCRNNHESARIHPRSFERKISKFISKLNLEQKMHNTDIYGDMKEDTVIFVVLVDKFAEEFNTFLTSLSDVHGIDESLIIFSHSYYEDSLNQIIRGIDFSRVLQIFYPHSVQTHSQDFPGYHPSDCESNMNKKTAERINCTGFPDIRGHYRDPARAERKHHWWWTANHVFERLNCTTKHTGLIIFLEDDFIFMKDFIYTALYMKNIAGSLPQCEFLSMGSNSVPNTDEPDEIFYTAEVSTWDPKFYSSILAFDKTVWNTIVSHYGFFCEIDDASWLRSLHYISCNRMNGQMFKVITSVVARAYKISTLCEHCRLFGCDKQREIEKIMNFEESYEHSWFPPYMEVYITVDLERNEDFNFDFTASEGGWADPRDRGLCHNMTYNKMKKHVMIMENEFNEYVVRA